MANNAVPFRTAAARHRKSSVYTIPWATGGSTSIGLNNVGYLNALQIVMQLSVTVGTGGTVQDAAAALDYIPRLGLRSPAGEQIWSWSTRELYDYNYRYFPVVTPASDPSGAQFVPATTGAQSVNLRLLAPLALNDGSGFDLGMLMRQISNNQYYLDLQFATTAQLVGTGSCVISGITGNVVVEEVFYDAIAANANPPVIPPDFSHFIRMRGIQGPALLQGQNVLFYAVGPVIVDNLFRVMNNGAADASVLANTAFVQLQSDSSTEIDNRTGQRLGFDQTMHLGKAMRAGVILEDYCDDVDKVNATMGRDFINSNLAAQLQYNFQYTGTPSGTSFIQTTYREIIGLAS